MRLFYFPVCPISNKFRILLKMNNIDYQAIAVTSKNIANTQLSNIKYHYLPILEDNDRLFKSVNSIKLHLLHKFEFHQLKDWFVDARIQYFEDLIDQYMFHDVYKNSVFEKTQKLVITNTYFPDNETVKLGISLQDKYLKEIEQRFEKYDWINKTESLNDISVFAMLASMDYCFLMPWHKYSAINSWYARLKSMENYNFILAERINNLLPPNHYSKIDF